MFIADLGSGNTCKNDLGYAKRMIDELAKVDKNRKITLKWQLFKEAGDNIPLKHDIFHMCYNYAKEKYGYKTTASVFDKESLDFLINYYEVPFVKIANRPDLYWLIREIPRKIPVIVSWNNNIVSYCGMGDVLCCVSNYPAKIEDYENDFNEVELEYGISDHTTNWDLYNKYKPQIYECHFVLEHDKNNPDGGLFSRTPNMIKEIL
jgi:sialic acid synthase SpsE